ncbi:restriction endonuclease subunit S [Tissierella sp. MSJ-40]|uniref:Restriction endonuclease subunit S n=1 Tax=Tissierella simiarum TaxID=2841534 RepID=A0ABS6E2M4_9FIRM|nr:restriction endonuclease subunit S [Tissierella simiarum]MBU5437162.1 restriction endonuclease subunit S [Tissierella simiarum]
MNKEEKEKLIREGKIRKEKPLPEITEEEKSFEIPEGWEWVRMAEVIDVRDGTHDTPKYVEEEKYPLITGKDFLNGKLTFEKTKYISKEDYEKIIKRSKVESGDIIYSMIGGNIGSMVMITDITDIAIKNVALFKRYCAESFIPKYLLYFLEGRKELMKASTKGGAQPFLSLTMLRNELFVLPPLEEQKRIVEKVDNIMNMLDELENELTTKI